MRISPPTISPAEALAKARAKAKEQARASAQSRDEARREAQESAVAQAAAEASAPKTSPAEIDARRAQQLLERAGALAERGDMGAAVLATRQSLALAPDKVEGHLLHARLLERARDFAGARDAYAKGVQLAPDRAPARENLARLDAYLQQSQGAARQFHFDEDELFAPAKDTPGTPTLAPTLVPAEANSAEIALVKSGNAEAEAVPQSASDASANAMPLDVNSTAMFDESMLPTALSSAIEVRLPPTRGEQNDASTPDRRKHNTPVATERRRRPSAGAVAGIAVGAAATSAAAPSAVASSGVASVAPMAPSVPRSIAEGQNHAEGRTRVETPRETPSAAPLRPSAASVVIAPVAASASVSSLTSTTAKRASDAISDLDMGASSSAASSKFNVPLDLDVPAAPSLPLWQQVVARPSFYARTLPLVGVALLGLGFLSWARTRAVSLSALPMELALNEGAFSPDAVPPAGITPVLAPGSADATSGTDAATALVSPVASDGSGGRAASANGFPISNAPAVFQAPPATAPASGNGGSTASAPSTSSAPTNSSATSSGAPPTARASNRGPNSNAGNANVARPRVFPRRVLPPARPVPSFPSVSLAPAPIPPASVRSTIPRANTPQNNGSNNIILPSPTIDLPTAPVQRQRVLPPSGNGLNPAGSPNRGYVRVTEGRVGNGVIPAQPSGMARDAERAANNAARQGQSDQAISQLSQAIRADSDNAGFRYQQRATLFLQRGDYSRAADDFQSAISAYQSQISSGTDVAQARRGLDSSRSGLNLALAGKR